MNDIDHSCANPGIVAKGWGGTKNSWQTFSLIIKLFVT